MSIPIHYIIRSKERPEGRNYFVAFHSYTTFFGGEEIARRFNTGAEATAYARKELFTSDAAFEVQGVRVMERAA
jgi:hypothetical protein